MRASITALVTVLVSVAAVTSTARALPHPPPLDAQAGCELWIGRASGNDPDVRVNLRLCPEPDGALRGEVQWSSTTSGWNVRAVEGRREGERLVLRDLRIVDERPAPGWRFCVIDRYELSPQSADALVGRYDSSSCNDHATLRLERVAQPPPSQRPPPAKTPAEDPTYRPPDPDPDPPAVAERSGCGCGAAGPTRLPLALAMLALFYALVARTGRNRELPLMGSGRTGSPGRSAGRKSHCRSGRR